MGAPGRMAGHGLSLCRYRPRPKLPPLAAAASCGGLRWSACHDLCQHAFPECVSCLADSVSTEAYFAHADA